MADVRKGDRVELETVGPIRGEVMQITPGRGRAVVHFDGEAEPREVRADSLKVVAVGGLAEQQAAEAELLSRSVTIPMWAARALLALMEGSGQEVAEFERRSAGNVLRNAVEEAGR